MPDQLDPLWYKDAVIYQAHVRAQPPALLSSAPWETLLDGHVRTLIERDLLLPFLQRQRWFGGKARPARGARFADWGLLRRGQQPLFITIVEVEFEDGDHGRYFVPLAICPEARGIEERMPHAVLAHITGARRGILFDGAMDNAFARALLDELDRQGQTPSRHGVLRAVQTSAFADLRGSDEQVATIARTSAEQSNTSIIFGDRLIMKLFRRVAPGINPDFEIGRHLTETTGFTRVPAVAAAFEYAAHGQDTATVALVQDLVESQGDGWAHATGAVARFLDRIGPGATPAGVPPGTAMGLIEEVAPPAFVILSGGYIGTAETLGRRTAEMHLALASDANDAAFSPEPLSREYMAALTASAIRQARQAFDSLETRTAATDSTDTAEVSAGARALLQSRELLIERIRSAESLPFAAALIRVHGDYHLGQVLWAEQDFFILDFEGEPARSLAERRAKQSPLKDVAGMVRSFSYAAYAGLFGHTAARPAEFDRLEPWARLWQQWVTSAFLRAYFSTAAGASFVPADPSQRDRLLHLFVLDKALYELNYELNNRPDWVRIPLRGILDLLA